MKIKTILVPSITGSIATNTNSAPIPLSQIAMYAVQIMYSASNCTFKIQASCDEAAANESTQAAAAAKVSNWTDVTGLTTAALTGAGSVLLNVPDSAYNWIRIVCTGTATVTSAKVAVKGM